MEDSESSSLSESSGLSSSGEKTKEQGEKQRDAYKKAQTQLQKSQKDEKKAKGDNEDLFSILLRFIQNPYYDELILVITELLQIATPSRFIIGLTALVYPESALHVLTKLERKSSINTLLSIHRYEIKQDFNEHTLHSSIRDWMSLWVQFSGNYLVAIDASQILQKKLLDLLTAVDSSQKIHRAVSRHIEFFFTSRNIHISTKTTDSYADFILKEYRKNLEKSVSEIDQELIAPGSTDSMNLFGIG